MPLTAAEIVQLPEFKNVVWDLKPTKKGRVPVAKGRGGPFELSYEVHGQGPLRLVWIMGLGAYKTGWQRQTKDLAHGKSSKYSSLIFDNRGMGESDKPVVRYSTSEMAKDTIEILDHLGWTDSRQLHVIGISMGGMIAQELALLIPDRVASLSLVSTAPRLVNTVGFIENLRNRINLFIPKPIDVQLQHVKANLFCEEWLNAPDSVGGFPTNGDFFAAQEISKRMDKEGFTRKGFMLQAIAAGWHHKSPEQLSLLGDRVGRDRIQVLHGTIDRMITVPHAHMLADELGGEQSGLKKIIFEGRGHVLPVEEREQFNELIEALVAKAEAMRES
ncbi:alpha/beta hydrolase [Xylona heveae TC161]|uniref:Alpha/beta hydrolase n=1 Tax=Xylona heveae (strain CBS 132557 / TC161) TaxID=1328760 RepID=A0A161TPL4_XYLHT|nr:alpha/beta hydrolase [Xylona heveae TC161]KZF24166.1 alpha/beta hydrolase [Xylona heveae TC161]